LPRRSSKSLCISSFSDFEGGFTGLLTDAVDLLGREGGEFSWGTSF
jgi:hypothetical protein